MKNIKQWFTICILIMSTSVFSQLNTGFEKNNVQLSYTKTTSIVFPYSVKSVDRGSQEVLVQKAKGVENILLLKAAKQDFTQTNLTVITADGKLYGFVLNFDEKCPTLNVVADSKALADKDIVFSSDSENSKEIEEYGQLALSRKKRLSGMKETRFSIQLQVTGIFIHQDVMYLRTQISNNSRINYEVDQLRFFIEDQKKTKRTAFQEIEVIPLYATSIFSKISDHSEVSVVFAISKFTIPEKKNFTVQLIEKNGGRHIELNIKNRDFDKLEILSSL